MCRAAASSHPRLRCAAFVAAAILIALGLSTTAVAAGGRPAVGQRVAPAAALPPVPDPALLQPLPTALPAPAPTLARLPLLARAGQATPDHRLRSTDGTAPTGVVGGGAGAAGFPLQLLLVLGGFLLIQRWIDRGDPKLADSRSWPEPDLRFEKSVAVPGAPQRGKAKELSFNERFSQLQVLRVALAIVTVMVCLGGIGQRVATRPILLLATAGYLLTVVAAEAFWRRTGSFRHAVHGLLLGADGLYLGLAVAASGGMSSPVRYLLILDVVATTLIASYRSGIRLTLWLCLLLQVGYELPRSRLPGWWRFPIGPTAHRELLSLSVALVAVAVLTGTAAAFNERFLRAGRRDLEVLAEFSRELERVVEPNLVGHQLCEALAAGHGFARSLVAIAENDRLRVLASRHTPALTHLAIEPRGTAGAGRRRSAPGAKRAR